MNWNAEFRLVAMQAMLYVEELAVKELKEGAKKWLSQEKFKVACDIIQEKLSWLPRPVIEGGVQWLFDSLGRVINTLGKEPELDSSLPEGGLE